MAVTISLSRLPSIDRIGLFPLVNPVFDFAYQNPTNCLHLYGYSGRIRIGPNEYEFGPGDVTCVESGTVYSLASEKPGEHWCVHYHDSPRPDESSIDLPDYLHLGGRGIFLREQLQQISRLWLRSQSSTQSELLQVEAQHRLKAVLISLENIRSTPKARRRLEPEGVWDDLLQWIDDNLHDWLPISRLAERLKISPGGFSQKFKKIQGITVSQYLLTRRIDRAKALLSTSVLSIAEVGSSVGIPDPQYFNKQFRRATGQSPTTFRQQNASYLTDVSGMTAVKDGNWSTSVRDRETS